MVVFSPVLLSSSMCFQLQMNEKGFGQRGFAEAECYRYNDAIIWSAKHP
jgi:hypothetical protein